MKRIYITAETTPEQIFNLLDEDFRDKRYFAMSDLEDYIIQYISSDSITSIYQLLVKVINETIATMNVEIHFNNDSVQLDDMLDIITKNIVSLEYLQHELIKTDQSSKFEYIGLKTAIINTFNVIKMNVNSIANVRNVPWINYKFDANDHLCRLCTVATIFKYETIRYKREYL